MRVGIQVDRRDLRRVTRRLSAFERKQIAPAMSSSLNEVASKVRTDVAREVATSAQVPQRLVRQRLRITRAKRNKLIARVWAGTRPISLKRLRPVQQRKGVRAGKRSVRSGFIVENLGGHVFKRKGQSRLPIQKQTVAIASPATSAIKSASRAHMKRTLPKIFERKLKFFINRAASARRS